LTIEQSDTNSLSARYNGATEADPITPYDDSGSTQGVALFTQQNNLYANGWNGRFYGGAWGQGQVDYDELTTLQDYLGTLLEPDIDPTDVTAYANVYDMLGAQTAAALFDINDKTSLRVGRDGSGGVPAEGDPVGVMMDVSGTGGLTMEAYLSGATELGSTTAGDWTLFSGGSGTQAVSNEGDVLVVTGGAAVNIGAYLPFGTTVGKIYKLEASVELGTATALDLSVTLPASGASIPTVEGGSTYEYVSGAETVSWYFVSTAATLQLKLTPRGDGLTGKLTSLTIKELPGYTAVAASDAARPTLKTYNSPISSRDVLTTTYSWTITDGGRA
jgi:hypothetical protein